MTHELNDIIFKAVEFQDQGLKCILASVVDLDGSSYRKPGVRMLISEDGQMIGAVSGGCVERDVYEQSLSVFETGMPKTMIYDGRYRLGCEGLLYILIEPMEVSKSLVNTFKAILENRSQFTLKSYYKKAELSSLDFGTIMVQNSNNEFALRQGFNTMGAEDLSLFEQVLEPRFKLLIFGGEHDAVKLCNMASILGWEVHVVTSVKDPKTLADFPGASSVVAQVPELVPISIDEDTAVVVMNHNYVQDLKYVLELESKPPRYIGILGSRKRKAKLIDDLFEQRPDFNHEVVDHIYSPAGLHIGSITPEEIALSILAEILAVYRGLSPKSLRNITNKAVL